VINNTGLIEAQALTTGAKGEIILFAHDGHMQVGGTIKAEGGFVETSGKTFGVTSGASILAGQWLIDPVDITIDQALANTIQASLGTGDVTISTAGGNTPDTSSGEVSTGSPRGDIHFNGNLTWSANTLVLRADNDIWIRGNLTGTGTAKLGLEYGQSAVGNSNNRTAYTILGSVSLPSLSLYTKFGTNGSTAFTNIPVFLNNGILRFGNGTTDSIDSTGLLKQPFYYDSAAKRWNQLTFSSLGLGVTLGVGGSGYADGTILFTPNNAASFASTSVNSSVVDDK
jgi:hypothetical protein